MFRDRPYDDIVACGNGGETPGSSPSLALPVGTIVYLHPETEGVWHPEYLQAEVLEDGPTVKVRAKHLISDRHSRERLIETGQVFSDLPKRKVWVASSSNWPRRAGLS